MIVIIGDNDRLGVLSRASLLSLEDRIKLYDRAFDASGHQLIVKRKHIIHEGNEEHKPNAILKSPSKELDSKAIADSNSDGISATFDVEKGIGDGKNEIDNDEEAKIRSENESSVKLGDGKDCHGKENPTLGISISPRPEINEPQGSNNDAWNHPMLTAHENNTCAICIEECPAGHTIVWSEDPTCRHVYHKECMVRYLALNAYKKNGGPFGMAKVDVNDNQCPICRKNYLTVRDEYFFREILQIFESAR